MTEEWKYPFPCAADFYCTETERTGIRQGQSSKGRGTRERDWSDEVYAEPDQRGNKARASLALLTLRVGDTQPVFFHTPENRQPVKERQTFALVALLEC